MPCVRFSRNKEPQQLSVEEDELLESVLFPHTPTSTFNESIGLAIKKLVMLRLAAAINFEAKKARAEAQRVLDLLVDE